MSPFPFPARSCTLPTDLNREEAVMLLMKAHDLILRRRSAYICNALWHVTLHLIEDTYRTAEQLTLVVEARLEGEGTYNGWLLEHCGNQYLNGYGNDHAGNQNLLNAVRAGRLAWIKDLITEIKESDL